MSSVLLLKELLRFRAAVAVQGELERMCTTHLHPSSADVKGLLPAAVFEGQQHAVMRGGKTDSTRVWVHPILDVRRRAAVHVLAASTEVKQTTYCLTGVQYAPGTILGVLESAQDDTPLESVDAAVVTAPLSDLRLRVPEPFYDDPLLPTLEAIEPHHASKNVLDLLLSKLCGGRDKLTSSFNQKRKKAWHLADEATYIFYEARRRLAEQLSRGSGVEELCSVHVSLQTSDAHLLALPELRTSCMESEGDETTVVVVDVVWGSAALSSPVRAWLTPDSTLPQLAGGSSNSDDGVCWQCLNSTTTRVRLPTSAAAVLRLYRRYTQASLSDTSCGFLPSLALLQLRYHALSGGEVEREAGWQAAVPPRVMDVFAEYPTRAADLRTVTAECFASPFNATRRFFFSVFPDTDAVFGSLGNFFACQDASSCVAKMYAALGEYAPSLLSPAVVEAASAASPTVLLRLECNPPFDHEVIAAAFAQLQRWLHTAPPRLALSALVIFPDSTQAHATAVRASVEESPLCRWVRSLAPRTCSYVHGAQQQQQRVQVTKTERGAKRPREEDSEVVQHDGLRLVQLSCPTRLLVLQADSAERLCSGAAVGTEVATVWRAFSAAHRG